MASPPNNPRRGLFLTLLLLLSLFLLPSSATTGADCYSVTFTSFTYSASLDQTIFYYSISIVSDGSNCKDLSHFDLEVFCPIDSSTPPGDYQVDDPTTGITGWKWDVSQSAGTTKTYELYIDGNVAGLTTGQWAIKASTDVFYGNTSVPNCEGGTTTPTPQPTTTPCDTVTSTVTVTVTQCGTLTPTPTPTPTEPTPPPQEFDCVIITVDQLILSGTNSSNNTFGVSLQTKPESDVTLTLTSSCVSLSTSTLTFTNLTWNIVQTVTAFNNLLHQTLNNCTIEIAASGPIECLGVNGSIPVYKSPPPNGGGGTWGDPHYLTFDGIRYDALSKGDYYFVRQDNAEFVVQLRQDLCGHATCNYAVAVRYRTCVFYCYINSVGVPQVSLVGDAHANGMVIGFADGKYSLFFLASQILVEITPDVSPNGRFSFLQVYVFLGYGYQQHVGGTAGFFDGLRANDFLMLSGALATDPEEFVDSWRVLAYEDLFVNPNALITPIFNASPFSGPLPIDVDASTFVAPGDITADLQAQAGTESPLKNNPIPYSGPVSSCTFNASDPLYIAAEAACSPFFPSTISDCCAAFGIPASQFISSCICDYVLSGGSMDFAFDSIDAYLQRCETTAELLGTSCFSCPRACSGHGTCSASTCTCDVGFGGIDCSEDWNFPPQLTALTPSTAKLDCAGTTLTLSGRHFYGSNLQCDFGSGLVVPAIVFSSYQLTCEVPTGFPLGTTLAGVRVIREDGKLSSSLSLTLTASCCQSPCQNGGTCKVVNNTVTCSCPSGLAGSFCEIVNDACLSNPCVRGTCSSSLGKFTCNCAGTGYYGPTCDWRVVCKALLNDTNANWPQALSFNTSWGTCLSGFYGKPSRPCQVDGTFGPVSNPCIQPSGTCPPQTYANANWTATPASTTAAGTCVSGWFGSPTRECLIDGSWSTLVRTQCARYVCQSEPYLGVTWPATNSLTTRYVTCTVGKGSYSRFCQANGQWSSTVSGGCV